MLEPRMVAVRTQGFALAAQIESARAAAMAPLAHGLAAALATSSSSCRLHTVVERARGSLVALPAHLIVARIQSSMILSVWRAGKAQRDCPKGRSAKFARLQSPHDVISKHHAGSAQPCDLGRKILHALAMPSVVPLPRRWESHCKKGELDQCESGTLGRSGGTRTPNPRFWRPVL